MSTHFASRWLIWLALLLTHPAQAAFTDNGDGTVTDTVTGLMWDQCAWGQSFNASAAGGKCAGAGDAGNNWGATTQNWAASLALANTANTANHRGYTGWRLPNRTELESLVDITKAAGPTIDDVAFPNTTGARFWSSTVYASLPSIGAWCGEFNDGGAYALPQNVRFRVRLVRSGQSFAAFDGLNPCCGPGIALTTGAGALWQMLALPGLPTASPASVADVFGSASPSNLDTNKYASAGDGWVIDRREVSTTPPTYVRLGISEALAVGTGYWIKSYAAPTGGKLQIDGSATYPNVTQAQGCAVAAGCKALTVTTVSGSNRYNLVGNPFAYPVAWSEVRIRVGGVGGTLYTPTQAQTANILANQIWIWNGTSYDTYDDSTQPGNLRYFQSFWVNVLPGANGQTVELLIPALKSTLSQFAPGQEKPPLPWYLAWLDLIAPPAHASELATTQAKAPAALGWKVRLKLDNHATGWHDHTNQLGQWQGAGPGYDARDLVEMAPFAKPYLTLVFPHPEWGPNAGDYATDFRPVSRRPDGWVFEVRADPVGGVVFLSWEGDAKRLKRMRLIDQQTGKIIKPANKRWAKKGYPITLTNPVQRYTWRYLGK